MYSIEDFIQTVKASDGLVCYGAGKRLEIFAQYFQGTGVLDKVEFCIDRDKARQGTKLRLQNREIEILPVTELTTLAGTNKVLLITNAHYGEVVDELSAQGFLNGIKYYCFTHLRAMILESQALAKKIPADCHLTSEAIIPKVIHYCWFGRSPLPDKYRKWMESWRKFCPDYEIREWNEDNYDITKNQYMYEAYQHKKWGFVPDYARLDIIYEHGGIYLDTDVELVGSLDDMLFQNGFAGFQQEEFINLGHGFGAVKGLPLIQEMRDDYDNLHFVKPDGNLNLTPSPVYQTDFLLGQGLRLNGEYQKLQDFVIYPEKMFSAKSFFTRRVRTAEYTRAIHHFDASWKDNSEKKREMRLEAEMNA